MLKEIIENKLIVTIVLTFLALSFKYLLIKLVRKKAKSKGEDNRDLESNIRNFLNFILVLLLFSLWAGELQKFALSIAAFAVAIVLATREFIQCIIGFFYLMSTRPFRVGDWMQVGDYVGEVSQIEWIKTTVLEVNIHTYQYTGKTLFIPNNKLITSTIKNLNFMKRYAMHHFTITKDTLVNPFLFTAKLLRKANLYCKEFKEVAARYNQSIEHKMQVTIAGPVPQIEVGTTELGYTKLDFTIFCPTDKAIEIEQQLTADFMHFWLEEHDKLEI
jgi:small-conductance mechanosensitive channel